MPAWDGKMRLWMLRVLSGVGPIKGTDLMYHTAWLSTRDSQEGMTTQDCTRSENESETH